MPDRWQTITWTNADPVHRCIYAALRGDELNDPHKELRLWNMWVCSTWLKKNTIWYMENHTNQILQVLMELIHSLWSNMTLLYNLPPHLSGMNRLKYIDRKCDKNIPLKMQINSQWVMWYAGYHCFQGYNFDCSAAVRNEWASGLHNFPSGLGTIYHYISAWISETPPTFILELVVSLIFVVCIILCTNLP